MMCTDRNVGEALTMQRSDTWGKEKNLSYIKKTRSPMFQSHKTVADDVDSDISKSGSIDFLPRLAVPLGNRLSTPAPPATINKARV